MTSTTVYSGPRTMLSEHRSPAHWLHVVSHTDPNYGGLSAAVPALAHSLDQTEEVRTTLAAFCHPGEEYVPAATPAESITFWPASRKQWLLHRSLTSSLADAVRDADALHIHGLWEESTAIACSLARKLGKPYILSAHGMLEPWALAAKRRKKQIYAALVERRNVAGAAYLHALTRAEAEQYRLFGAKGPVAVIPNAVDIPEDVHAEEFLSHFPELRGKRLVLFLSRLHPKKGVDLLLSSWAAVCRKYPETHLVLAGPNSDGMKTQLLAQAQQAGIDDRVTFTGMLVDSFKWSAFDAAEAYVLPSHSEGLSMALLEAMGVGLPVIATYACNMPQISKSRAGWEVDTTVEALTAALDELLRRPMEENWAMGRRGARLIADRYTPQSIQGQFAALYRHVLGGPRPGNVEVLPGGVQ